MEYYHLADNILLKFAGKDDPMAKQIEDTIRDTEQEQTAEDLLNITSQFSGY